MSGAELVGQAGSLGLVLVVVDQPSRVALAVPHWSGRGVHKGGVGDRVGRIRSLRVRHGAQVFLDKSAGFKIKSKLFSFLFKMFRLFQHHPAPGWVPTGVGSRRTGRAGLTQGTGGDGEEMWRGRARRWRRRRWAGCVIFTSISSSSRAITVLLPLLDLETHTRERTQAETLI